VDRRIWTICKRLLQRRSPVHRWRPAACLAGRIRFTGQPEAFWMADQSPPATISIQYNLAIRAKCFPGGGNESSLRPKEPLSVPSFEHRVLDEPDGSRRSGSGPGTSNAASGRRPRSPDSAHTRSPHFWLCRGQGVARRHQCSDECRWKLYHWPHSHPGPEMIVHDGVPQEWCMSSLLIQRTARSIPASRGRPIPLVR